MRIKVWKQHQEPTQEAPAHEISHDLAMQICAVIAVKILSDLGGIQLKTKESMREIKDRFRKRNGELVKLPIRDWREPLLLVYPHKSQESYARLRRKERAEQWA